MYVCARARVGFSKPEPFIYRAERETCEARAIKAQRNRYKIFVELYCKARALLLGNEFWINVARGPILGSMYIHSLAPAHKSPLDYYTRLSELGILMAHSVTVETIKDCSIFRFSLKIS